MIIVSKSRAAIKIICLFGPTAVGKTEIVRQVFKAGFEIISADSMQVYKYLDIGTAKPSPEILEDIPHHLIGIVEPDYQFNVGEFVRRAESLIPTILSRGALPVLAGGTAYYLKTFACGLSEAPAADRGIRAEIRRIAAQKGLAELYGELIRIDPRYAETISCNDRSRILRALEVYRITGKPLSDFKLPASLREGYAFLFLGLTRTPEKLKKRINARVDSMFKAGLIEEVKSLLRRGYKWSHPGLKGIGYREFRLFQRGCLDLSRLKDLIKANTWRYAKRQNTFFQSLPSVRWYGCDDLDSISDTIKRFQMA